MVPYKSKLVIFMLNEDPRWLSSQDKATVYLYMYIYIQSRQDGLRHFHASIMDTDCNSQKVPMDTKVWSQQLVCSVIVEAAMFMMDSRDVHYGQQLRVIIFLYSSPFVSSMHLVIRTCWMVYILSWILYLYLFVIRNIRYFFLKQHLLHDIHVVVGFSFKSDGTETSCIWMIFTLLYIVHVPAGATAMNWVHKDCTCQSISIDQRPKSTSLHCIYKPEWYSQERRQHLFTAVVGIYNELKRFSPS